MSVSKEWLDELVESKLPQALRSVREKKPVSVVDFVRLVQLDWRTNRIEARPNAVEWDEAQDEERR